jgi:hypothetical protein
MVVNTQFQDTSAHTLHSLNSFCSYCIDTSYGSNISFTALLFLTELVLTVLIFLAELPLAVVMFLLLH